MGGGFQYLDLIFFGIVAVFVILRLRSVLGKRTGNERRRDPFASAPAKDQPVAARAPNAPMPDIAAKPAIGGPIVGAPVAAGVARIRAADPNFDEGHFIAGARAAFEMIVGAYAAGDAGALRPLLSDEVFANFNRAIEERQKNGHTLSTTLVGIRSAEIIEADLQNRNAVVTVKIVSDQINVTRDGEGQGGGRRSGSRHHRHRHLDLLAQYKGARPQLGPGRHPQPELTARGWAASWAPCCCWRASAPAPPRHHPPSHRPRQPARPRPAVHSELAPVDFAELPGWDDR